MKPRSQILSAISLVPIALITLPEHWPTFAKVAAWYVALTGLIWIINRVIEWRKCREFERLEQDRIAARADRVRLEAESWARIQVKADKLATGE